MLKEIRNDSDDEQRNEQRQESESDDEKEAAAIRNDSDDEERQKGGSDDEKEAAAAEQNEFDDAGDMEDVEYEMDEEVNAIIFKDKDQCEDNEVVDEDNLETMESDNEFAEFDFNYKVSLYSMT